MFTTDYDRSEALHLFFDAEYPGWEDREVEPETSRYVSEWDMPVEDCYDSAVSDEDWQAFIEMTFVDFAEREV